MDDANREAVERFTPDVIGSKNAWPNMTRHKTGGYVRYSDYAALTAESDALRAAAKEAAKQLRIIAGMDLMGASATAYNAARDLEATLSRKATP